MWKIYPVKSAIMIVWSFRKTTIRYNFIFLILSPLIINNKKAHSLELFYFRHSHHPTRRKNGWFSHKATPLISVIFNTSPLESVCFMVPLYVKIWQGRAVSSLLGSSPRIGGAIPPPATRLIVMRSIWSLFFVRRESYVRSNLFRYYRLFI